MYSQQVNFYLTPQDQVDLEEKFRAKLNFVSIESITSGRVSAPILRDTLDLIGGKEHVSICLLLEKHLNRIKMKYFEQPDMTAVDEIESPVISFTRCFFDETVLRRGRFYAVKKFYDGRGILVEKDREFIAFVQTLMLITRRSLTKVDNYYGAGALKLKESGFLLK